MRKKIDFNKVKQFVENLGYELITKEYLGIKEKLILKDKDGYCYFISFDNLKHGNIPLLAHKSNPYSIQNIKLLIKNTNPDFTLVSDTYEGKDTHLIIKDKIGYYYSISFSNIKNHGINPLFVDSHNYFSIQNIKLFLKINNCDYTLLTDKYINERTKLILTDSDGYLYTKTWTALRRLNNFHIASDDNLYSITNIKLWCKLNNKPFELLSEEYERNNIKLKWKCLKEGCKEEFEMNWDHISRGVGCPFCDGKQVGISNCLATKNPELASEWHSTLNGDLTSYDVTCGKSQKVWWICKECDHEWFALIANRSNGRGCPKCAESKGEKQLDIILTQYNILHDKQYTFDDLIGLGGGLLKYDVPLFWDKEKTKLRMLIEYDGEFHYEKQYEDDGFETLQIHDQLKNEYCQKHNIKLLRIPYWDYDNIEQILCQELNLPYNQNNQDALLTKVSYPPSFNNQK